MQSSQSQTPSSISSIISGIYPDEVSPVVRAMQKYRPYICPFERVVCHVPENARVLDVGCGSGLFLLLLKQLGLVQDGTGLDLSASAIEVANKGAMQISASKNLEFLVHSAEDPLPAGDWDVVSSIDVLHHIPENAQPVFIQNLMDAVPPGGRLIIKDMVARPAWRAAANALHDLVIARQRIYQKDMNEVLSWFDGNDFSTIASERVNTLWYGHWLLVLEKDR